MKVELSPGEEICPKCKGKGENPDAEENCSIDLICFRCNGTGKVDWVTKAMGERPINPYESISIPLVRRAYPMLIAKDLAGVQPIKGTKVV
jgi:DnaJ-class molecular chaperone